MIPFNTTTVTITRAEAGTGDRWTDEYADTPAQPQGGAVVAAGVRAVISLANGTQYGPGDNQKLTASLCCDPVTALDERCVVTDDTTGESWAVDWAWTYQGTPGGALDHTEANLSRTTGLGTETN